VGGAGAVQKNAIIFLNCLPGGGATAAKTSAVAATGKNST